MKSKLFSVISILSVLAVALGVNFSQVKASAYTTSFTTSVTYQNVGTGPATVNLNFYEQQNGTAIPIGPFTLNPLAGTSLYVGGLTQLSSGFHGSAVLQSNQPMVATLVQLPAPGSGVTNRPLSNGFDSGAPDITLATVLKNTFGSTSQFSIQNVDQVGADIKVNFFAVGSATPIILSITNLPSGAAKYIDLGTLADITTSTFNGSVKISAVKTGTTTPGSIVASVLELSVAGPEASAFEGTTAGANTVYMPSAMCNYGTDRQSSSYAVQNVESAGGADATVNVKFSNGNIAGPYTITAGGKQSVPGCSGGNTTGFLGSATITSTGGKIVAIGKVIGGGLSTAFLGATSGADTVAAAYVRWTTAHWYDGTRQRAYIAIQNIGSDLPDGSVTVSYFDKDGNKVGVHTLGAIAAGAKANSDASKIGAPGAEFGVYGAQYGGAVVVQGPVGSKLAVIIRVQTKTSTGSVGEDYNGVSIARITLP
ncbi:MAG: hypothetical protein PHQ40_17295 [Anaerolineaceae bacterium]|nr:hypothetical protein [Anaerolineaceae bacterium]